MILWRVRHSQNEWQYFRSNIANLATARVVLDILPSKSKSRGLRRARFPFSPAQVPYEPKKSIHANFLSSLHQPKRTLETPLFSPPLLFVPVSKKNLAPEERSAKKEKVERIISSCGDAGERSERGGESEGWKK